jgi:pimeloyl-ACP methyl ester carboxylesterase
MFDRGSGHPLLVIPGVQGRWEWMRPVLDVLARDFRVVSYSLAGDIGSGVRLDPGLGFENFLRQVDAVLDRAGIEKTAMLGVSYGGVIAVQYAASRPSRVSHLVLASAPGPGWKPTERQARYAARPWLSMPAFCVTALDRLGAEIREALPDWPSRIAFMAGYAFSAVRAPMLPHVMSRRVRLHQETSFADQLARVTAPTLVVTGDPALDKVVPVASTREYVSLIRGARYAMMDRTGHLGSLTQPERFAGIVKEFIGSHS